MSVIETAVSEHLAETYDLPDEIPYDEAETNGQILLNRVQRGVAFFDQVYAGWCDEIDQDDLDMSNAVCCISGQLREKWIPAVREAFEDFPYGSKYPETLGLEYITAMYNDDVQGISVANQHDILRGLWLDAINGTGEFA